MRLSTWEPGTVVRRSLSHLREHPGLCFGHAFLFRAPQMPVEWGRGRGTPRGSSVLPSCSGSPAEAAEARGLSPPGVPSLPAPTSDCWRFASAFSRSLKPPWGSRASASAGPAPLCSWTSSGETGLHRSFRRVVAEPALHSAPTSDCNLAPNPAGKTETADANGLPAADICAWAQRPRNRALWRKADNGGTGSTSTTSLRQSPSPAGSQRHSTPGDLIDLRRDKALRSKKIGFKSR